MKRYLSQANMRWAWALKHDLGDPYKLHQWIWESLPKDADANRDFLFRADVKNDILRLLLLSERTPISGGELAWRTTEVSATFLSHGSYRFELKANPTFRRSVDHKRLALFDEMKIREWFVRKFAAAGCEVSDLETTAPRRITFRKNGKSGTLCSVEASGLLSVRNETAFRTTFDTGIGPAKGFGFGLLLLQPISELN